MKIFFAVLIVIFFSFYGTLFGQYCTNDSRYSERPYFDSTEISVGANIQFGTALDYLGNAYTLRMDLYYPNLAVDLSPKRPFVMLFHGGGFISGDKQSGDIKDLCFHMARRGFVCATVNYRLGYDFSEYGQYKARYRAIQDGHAALRYVVNNANTIRIDTSWIFVGGQSAGSLLALGMVYADPSELDSISLLYNTTATSAELGDLFTSGNSLVNSYSIKGIFNNWGGVTASEMDADEMLPTVAFHGEKDTVVRIDSDASFLHYTLQGSRAIHTTLIANATCSEITIDTLGEHGIFRNASSEFRAGRASCFFKGVFCSACSDFYTTDSIPSVCSDPLAAEEMEKEVGVQLYPNPFEQSFQIQGLQGELKVSIYNNLGQLVFEEVTSNGTVQPDLLPGIYWATLGSSITNDTMTTKLLKK
ncbi:MAG: alpha/beta hydrolase fold domain-containing protein [Cytophagaceae bacterium]|nr:alpha/beta hydrolase fold domain-containing protein [Cytophagaceae bacterium]